MRAKAIGSLLGAATVAALLIPGAAGAKPPGSHPAGRETPPQVTETFEVQGTNGFKVNFSLVHHSRLVIEARTQTSDHRGSQSAIYTLAAPQAPGSDDIKAGLGSLGRVDVRFVPESTHEDALFVSLCNGGKTVVEDGHFVGQISFRGERGYTRVQAGRAAGTITREPSRTCKLPKPSSHEKAAEEKEEEEAKEVNLNVTAAHGKVQFEASRFHTDAKGQPKTFTGFTAVGERHRGKITEIALVLILFEKSSLFVSPEPLYPTREATINPPAPFTGSATFRRESPHSVSWSGDLKVELPGFRPVPLTGGGTRATMCQAPACKGL